MFLVNVIMCVCVCVVYVCMSVCLSVCVRMDIYTEYYKKKCKVLEQMADSLKCVGNLKRLAISIIVSV